MVPRSRELREENLDEGGVVKKVQTFSYKVSARKIMYNMIHISNMYVMLYMKIKSGHDKKNCFYLILYLYEVMMLINLAVIIISGYK